MKKNKMVILLAIGACVISIATLSVFADNGDGSPKTSSPPAIQWVSGSCSSVNGPAGAQCIAYNQTVTTCVGTTPSDCQGTTNNGPDYQCTCTLQGIGYACVPNT
jgi:hypothetical protein